MNDVIGISDIIFVPIILGIIYFWANSVERNNMVTEPIYKFFKMGLFCKIYAGLAFALIYLYYYGGGDTINYYYGGKAVANLIFKNPSDYISVMTGELSYSNFSLFDYSTGWPPHYMWRDSKSMFVIRFITPFLFLTSNSFLATTILLAALSYTGIWRLFRVFAQRYRPASNELALAFLFVPSVVFWGSGIMKDTLTLSATCWFTSSVYLMIIKGEDRVIQIIYFPLEVLCHTVSPQPVRIGRQGKQTCINPMFLR